MIFLLATGFLYGAVAVYAAGYLKGRDARYVRRCSAGLNAFAWAMLAAPLMGSLALLWIAIEVTTVISALLVAIEDTDRAAEAAWKYVLIASAGLSLALLATIFAYYAGAQVLGEHYNLAVQPLIDVAAKLPKTPVRLAFLLAVVGYGTKVGLFPVHTWLPDSYTAFGYANPTRRVLASVLHTQAEVVEVEADGDGDRVPHLRYASDVVEVVETWLYRPGHPAIRRRGGVRETAPVRPPRRLPAVHAHRAGSRDRGSHGAGLSGGFESPGCA